jgi:hypothetical protein
MTGIAKIVSQRLRASASAGPHPDADLLTAFAENSLRAAERGHMMEHLSQCQDCRQVIALALPQLEIPQSVASPAESGSWLRWPVLRWVASAACVVAVGAAVSLHFAANRTKPASPLASREVALVGGEAPESKRQDQPAAPAKTAQAFAMKKAVAQVPQPEAKLAASAGLAKELDSASPAASVPAMPAPQPGADLAASAAPAKDNSPSPAALAPAPPAAAKLFSPSAQMAMNRARARQAKVASSAQVAESAGAEAGVPVSGAVASLVSRAPGVVTSAATDAATRADAKLAPRWTLTAEGTLLRSLDQGKTWITVPVADGVAFRALSATGGDIWIAGPGARLFHSSDGGEHWQQMKLVADGQPLTADIIGVEFTDLQHGKLTTADNQTWLTSDAGQTWQKQ